MLYPPVILATLAWGVVNGSKLALVFSLFLSGVGQWWLGRVLGLGPIARVWTAGMAVVGGHLLGRMEHGIFGLVIAVAACALVLPSLVLLAHTGSRRAAVVFGFVLALVALAGQGYMQMGLALTLPAAMVLIIRGPAPIALVLRRFGFALLLAFLLAAPFLVPLLHFLPQIAKNIDVAFASTQPIAFVPLNLLINDWNFYAVEVMRKLPFPWLYVYYIGWIPVLFALWALRGEFKQQEGRERLFLLVFVLLAFFMASGEPLAWLTRTIRVNWFTEQIAGIRYPTLFTALAVPAILALAGMGVERLLKASWLRLRLTLSVSENGSPLPWQLNLSWLFVIPMIMALLSAWSFNGQWVTNTRLDPGLFRILNSLRTPDLAWVNPPFGEQFWIEPAVRNGLKISIGTQGWVWRDHQPPEALLEAARGGPPAGMTQLKIVDQVPIYKAGAGREYAAVTHANGTRTVCTATGIGGDIDVSCQLLLGGTLTAKENNWSGWRVTVDGKPAQLLSNQWLAVELPTGNHIVQFRYRPWDVPLGLALCLLGVLIAFYNWFRSGSSHQETAA